ncbi:hypothetical protein ACFQD2_01970 [Pseudomonas lini]
MPPAARLGEEAVQVATILFPQAKLHSEVMVNLHPGSRVMLCDAFCLHPLNGVQASLISTVPT